MQVARIFHVSDQPAIREFAPRPADVLGGAEVVWAINEVCLPNYLTPRACPRVTFHVGPDTLVEDKEKWLGEAGLPHVVAIEAAWLERLQTATLYVYEFAPKEFHLHDENAGYYISRTTQRPLDMETIPDLPAELARRNVELRVVESLKPLFDAIQHTSFRWSMIRMRNAAHQLAANP